MSPSTRNLRGLLILTSLSLTLVAPARLHLYSWEQGAFSPRTFPPHLQPTREITSADMNGDGLPERVILQEATATILHGENVLWVSPQDWQVVQAQITDLNHDGGLEVALLLWREFAPWPIDTYLAHPGRIQDFHDQDNRSCHLILIGWRGEAMGEIWAGSALADPLLAFTSVDLNNDGRNELIALEGQYDDPLRIGRTITVWEWNGFGFSLLWRGPEGDYRAILPVRSDDTSVLLLIQGNVRR